MARIAHNSTDFLTPRELYMESDRVGRRADRARTVAGISATLAIGSTVLFVVSMAKGERPDLHHLGPVEAAMYLSIGLWGVTLAEGSRSGWQTTISGKLSAQALELNPGAYAHAIPAEVVAGAITGRLAPLPLEAGVVAEPTTVATTPVEPPSQQESA